MRISGGSVIGRTLSGFQDSAAVGRLISGGSSARDSRPNGQLARRASEDLQDEVKQVITFGPKRELLRASRLTAVMRNAAAILGAPGGSAETFNLSGQVDAIDVFLSHNWVVHRRKKFLCLAMHFNLRGAFVAVIISLIVGVVLTVLGVRVLVVETPISTADISLGKLQHGYTCTLILLPAFLLVLLFGQELSRLVGMRGCTVFLDKTCIHQVDRTLQVEGIRKLGAFLRSSTFMVAIFSDVYLTKLWTVYEMACFVSLHPSSHLSMVPTFQPVVVIVGVLMVYGAVLLQGICKMLDAAALLVASAGAFLSCSITMFLARHWAKEKERTRLRLAEFRVRSCTCACEDDRPVVYRNITLLMKATNETSKDASEGQCLDAFDRIIRKRLFRSFMVSIGSIGLRYRHIVAIHLPYMGMAIDIYMLGEFPYQAEWINRYRVFVVVWWAIFVFGIWPLLFFAVFKLHERCLHLRGCQDWLYMGLLGALHLALCLVSVPIVQRILWAAISAETGRDGFAVALVLLLVSTSALVSRLYKGRQREDEEEKHEEKGETRTCFAGRQREAEEEKQEATQEEWQELEYEM